MEQEDEHSSDEMSPEKKEIYDRCSRRFDRAVKSSLIGVLVGAGLTVSPFILGRINEDRNPYNETAVVQTYYDMQRTLLQLQHERTSALNSQERPPSYIPEGLENEFEILFGSDNNQERIQDLDSHITRVESDMKITRGDPQVESYEKWNDNHLTFDDMPHPTYIGGMTLMALAGIYMIGAIIRSTTGRAREVIDLEYETMIADSEELRDTGFYEDERR